MGLRGLAGSRGLMPTAGSRPAPGITVAGCSRWAPVLSMLHASVLGAVAHSALWRSWAAWAIRGGHVDAAHALRSSKKGGGIAHFVHPTVRCYRRAEQTRGYGTLGPGSVDPQCQNYPPHSGRGHSASLLARFDGAQTDSSYADGKNSCVGTRSK